MKRTFVRTKNPQDKTEILRIHATGGGFKDLPKGVAVDVTVEEAETVDKMDGVIIRKSREFQRPVKEPVKETKPERTQGKGKGKGRGGDKKWQE